jgi:N-acetylglucosaminyl-diphospho-decaprenol L-rhamnosyltransferase
MSERGTKSDRPDPALPGSERAHLAVVIVNYRTGGLAVDCLGSLCGEIDPARDRVIVVDNDSGDGSPDVIDGAISRHGWGAWACVLRTGRNGGFSAGNNAGIRAVDAELYLLLNPDTVVRPGAIEALRCFMEERPRVGICGARLEEPDGRPQGSAHRFPSPLRELDSGARLGVLSRVLGRGHLAAVNAAAGGPHRSDWVSGAALCVRRGVIEDVGMLDEGYFLYFEEVDLCKRAWAAGWEVWHVPEARIVHLEGSATGIKQQERRRPRYWFESRRRFFVTHYGVAGLMAADVLWAVGRASLECRRALRLGGGFGRLPRRFALDLLVGDLAAIARPATWRRGKGAAA